MSILRSVLRGTTRSVLRGVLQQTGSNYTVPARILALYDADSVGPVFTFDDDGLDRVQGFSGSDAEFLAQYPSWPYFKDSGATQPAYEAGDALALIRDRRGDLDATLTGYTLGLTGGRWFADDAGSGQVTVTYPAASSVDIELVQNGDGSSLTGWLDGRSTGALSLSGGEIVNTSAAGSAVAISQQITGLTIGKTYAVTMDVDPTGATGGFPRVSTNKELNAGIIEFAPSSIAKIHVDTTFSATATTMYVGAAYTVSAAGQFGKLDNVSVIDSTDLEYTVGYRAPDGSGTYADEQAYDGAETVSPGDFFEFWATDKTLTTAEIRYALTGDVGIYVDSASGSDSNIGSEWAPLATLSAAKTEATAYGDSPVIRPVRGGHWREYLDISALVTPSVIGYGDGADPLPKIDCANVATNGSFSLAASQTNTYQISWSHSVTTSISKCKLRVWEDGARLKWVSSIANCEAEAGTFFVDNSDLSNPATIYVHPNGSTNPASDGKTYEITARDHALKVGQGAIVTDIHTTRNAGHDGSFINREGGTFTRVLATDGVVHNMWVAVGSTANGCVAYDIEPSIWRNLNATLFVTYDGDGSDLTTNYVDCYAYSDAAASNVIQPVYAHTNGGSAKLEGINISGFKAYAPVATFNVADTNNLTVSDSWVEYPSGRDSAANGVGIYGGETVTVDNLVAINPGRLFFTAGTVASDVKAYVVDNVNAGLVYAPNVELSDSTLIFATPAKASAARGVGYYNKQMARFEGNVVESAGEFAIVSYTDGGLASDGNVIWGRSNRAQFALDESGLLFPSWQSATGLDAGSAEYIGQASSICTDPANNDWTFTDAAPDDDGRTAGSRKTVAAPDWSALTTQWDAGFIS